LLSIISLDFR